MRGEYGLKGRTGLRLSVAAVILALGMTAPMAWAQGPNLRLDLPDPLYPGLMRPPVPAIARTGALPVDRSLEDLKFLGRFQDRFGREIGTLPGKLGIDGNLYDRVGAGLYGAFDGRTLRLEVRSSEPEPSGMRRDFDFYFPDDRVELHLDLNHDHLSFERIAVMPDGEARQWTSTVREKHLSPDRGFRQSSSEIKVFTTATVNSAGWTLRVDIPLPDSVLGESPWTVIGLNAVRYRSVHGEETSMWCPDSNRVWAPLYFGDLYLGAPPALVKSVALGRINWGENRGELFLDNENYTGPALVTTWNSIGLYESREYRIEQGRLVFSYNIDPRELLNSALSIRLGGREWGRYVFGWKGGMLLTHQPTGKTEATRPAPGEPDFRWKLARYVLDRLPLLERSPDGLTLMGEDLSIDLASPDPFTPLARIIMERFGGDEERLVAATLLLCQHGVMVSSGTGERVNEPLGALGTLRAGAAFCNSYADLLRELISRIEDSSGQPFKTCVVCYKDGPANTRGWPHHWQAGVSYRGGLTLLDSELGVFYINPENSFLATLQELLEHPDWADSTAHGMSEYFKDRPIGDFGVRESGDLWILE